MDPRGHWFGFLKVGLGFFLFPLPDLYQLGCENWECLPESFWTWIHCLNPSLDVQDEQFPRALSLTHLSLAPRIRDVQLVHKFQIVAFFICSKT